MEPYYQTESATLYLGDAREVLAPFTKESLDLVVTDPPYGVNYDPGWRESAGLTDGSVIARGRSRVAPPAP